MRRTTTSLLGLAALLWAAPVASEDLLPIGKVKSPSCTGCGKQQYGTTIEWQGSPIEAAKKAQKEEKLVFVLHVSGHFEDAKFT